MEKSSSNCKAEGCSNKARYCGYCDRHYRRGFRGIIYEITKTNWGV